MTQHTRPHAYIPGASALTGTSIDDLIRPSLQLAFPLPLDYDPNDAKFRRLLDALARRPSGRYLGFYNGRRPHSSFGGQTPDQAYANQPTPIPAAA